MKKKVITYSLLFILGLALGIFSSNIFLKDNYKTNNKISINSETKIKPNSNKEYIVEDNKKENNVLNNKKVILNISPQNQKEWNYCAPTTVSMMLSSKNINVDQYTLAKEMGTYEPFGTHNKDAIRILNKYMFGYEIPQDGNAGYRLETVSEVNQNTIKTFKERLIKNIKEGYPMYYTFDSSKVYPGKHGEHNVIGIGYLLNENKDDIEYLYYLDPDYNVNDKIHGGLKIIKIEDLLNSMLTCEEPNYAW
ncbi:C39 family peptidase [Gemelliphila palaticanis]|uniref:C39 family peptidase n=1 Tax=Gemelliphila palaticanis TaxID=81950 RepID=A0ABX2T4Z6_9BACL|nr:C39 family peptidase [Gemella palaticanis]MBF0716141.1 C39 family peptidase [Gemella palaticanis]NYS48071.1 C39 family peptidase [Gemella palaticanis]